jgi:hypothetical protein
LVTPEAARAGVKPPEPDSTKLNQALALSSIEHDFFEKPASSPKQVREHAFLAADLTADRVFLLIQGPLFRAGDVAIVESCHRSFLTADGAIFPVELACLVPRNLSLSDLLIDPPVLIGQTVVDLLAARMVTFPLRLG